MTTRKMQVVEAYGSSLLSVPIRPLQADAAVRASASRDRPSRSPLPSSPEPSPLPSHTHARQSAPTRLPPPLAIHPCTLSRAHAVVATSQVAHRPHLVRLGSRLVHSCASSSSLRDVPMPSSSRPRPTHARSRLWYPCVRGCRRCSARSAGCARAARRLPCCSSSRPTRRAGVSRARWHAPTAITSSRRRATSSSRMR